MNMTLEPLATQCIVSAGLNWVTYLKQKLNEQPELHLWLYLNMSTEI